MLIVLLLLLISVRTLIVRYNQGGAVKNIGRSNK